MQSSWIESKIGNCDVENFDNFWFVNKIIKLLMEWIKIGYCWLYLLDDCIRVGLMIVTYWDDVFKNHKKYE